MFVLNTGFGLLVSISQDEVVTTAYPPLALHLHNIEEVHALVRDLMLYWGAEYIEVYSEIDEEEDQDEWPTE